MLKRVITGAVLIAAVAVFFLLRNIDTLFFELLIMFFCIMGTFEMAHSLKDKISGFQKVIIIVFSVLFVPMFHYFGIIGAACLYFIFGFTIISALVFDAKNSTVESVGLSLMSAFYPALFLTAMLVANDLENNSQIALLLMFIIAPSTDTFAYIVGCSVKGAKLCPQISPKKTISGAIGGILGGALSSLLVYFLFKNSFIYFGRISAVLLFVGMGIISAALTIFGDLVESVIKRKLNLKDMGKILPGHGGVLDRIDGIIYASIFIAVVFYLL